jgi:hypothetical protein
VEWPDLKTRLNGARVRFTVGRWRRAPHAKPNVALQPLWMGLWGSIGTATRLLMPFRRC